MTIENSIEDFIVACDTETNHKYIDICGEYLEKKYTGMSYVLWGVREKGEPLPYKIVSNKFHKVAFPVRIPKGADPAVLNHVYAVSMATVKELGKIFTWFQSLDAIDYNPLSVMPYSVSHLKKLYDKKRRSESDLFTFLIALELYRAGGVDVNQQYCNQIPYHNSLYLF